MKELCYSELAHTLLERRQEALGWLETHERPNRKQEPAAYWKWWRTYHFAMDDETWHKFVERSRKPKTKRYKPSQSSGYPAYRKPGHPHHEEYLSHMRAYNKEHR